MSVETPFDGCFNFLHTFDFFQQVFQISSLFYIISVEYLAKSFKKIDQK